MSPKLTPAQKNLLAAVQSGGRLRQEFDVWRGYWWEIDRKKINHQPPEALLVRRLIVLAKEERIASGRSTRLAQPAEPSPRHSTGEAV